MILKIEWVRWIMVIAAFVLRYIPFWSIPLFIILVEIAYIYYRRGKRGMVFLCVFFLLFLLLLTISYYFLGGPEEVSKIFTNWFI